MMIIIIMITWSPLQDFRLFEPRPWKILATTYEQKRFLSNPDPGESLVSGNLVMEISIYVHMIKLYIHI